MTVLAAVLLGVVQGLTEFLPISSSAHLILGRAFFGWDAGRLGLAFDVSCHVGTLLAVIIYFRAELLQMAAALPRAFFWSPGPSPRRSGFGRAGGPPRPGAGSSGADPDPVARMIRLIVIGTAPIVVAGVFYVDRVEQALRTPRVAAWMLALGAALMMIAERAGAGRGPRAARAAASGRRGSGRRGIGAPGSGNDEHSLAPGGALAIGLAQAAALVPGVSRSGATISVGLFLGLRRDAAARFTFLLSIPAILAAAGREGVALAGLGLTAEAARLFAIGMVVSGVVGYLAIRSLLRYLAGHRLDAFAYYRFALAAVTFVWLSRT